MRKYTNTYIIKDNNGVLVIKGNNKYIEVLIDVEDIDKLKPYSWRINDKGYIISDYKRNKVRLHNIILDRDTSNTKKSCVTILIEIS